MSVSLDTVKKYSPVFRFHENEREFPCSIEHILQNSTLRYRTFAFATQIPSQTTSSTPSLASFQNKLYMVYQESNGFDIYITRSSDGLTWNDTQKIPGITGGAPTLVKFKDSLWMVWHGVLSSQLWIAHSNDGLHWEGIQKINKQEAWKTAITVYKDQLLMVYADSLSSQLWMSTSADGKTWVNTRRIEGQFTTDPAITTFGNEAFMVYVDPGIKDWKLWISRYSGDKWTPPQVIKDQNASAPALTTIGGYLFLMYSEPNSEQRLWASHSTNGIEWKDTQLIQGQNGDIPDLCVFNNSIYAVYRHGTQIWSTYCRAGDLSPHTPIPNPTQKDLQTHSNESYYIDINETQYPGQPIPSAPLYYAIQRKGDQITIHYLLLYANQSGQTARALRAGTEFDCVLRTFGEHQGDLEHFTITLLNKNGTYTVQQVGFEAHGDISVYPPNQVKWEDETHAIVHVIYFSRVLISS